MAVATTLAVGGRAFRRRWPGRHLTIAAVVCLLLLHLILHCSTVVAESVVIGGMSIEDYATNYDNVEFVMADSVGPGVAIHVSMSECHVLSGGLVIRLLSSAALAASPDAVTLNVTMDGTVAESGTTTITGYAPKDMQIRINGLAALMTSPNPVLNIQGYVPGIHNTFSVVNVAAQWTDSGHVGGPVILAGGSYLYFNNGLFHVESVFAKDATSLFTYAGSQCTDTDSEQASQWCINTVGGIIAFDFNYCENCIAPMIDIAVPTSVAASDAGTVRFANNTISGGKPFFRSAFDYGIRCGEQNGNVIVSGIRADGALFELPLSGFIGMRGAAKFSMRHINVGALGIPSNGKAFPYAELPQGDATQQAFIGNITEAGVLFDETTQSGYANLDIDYSIATLVNDVGFVVYSGAGYPTIPQPSQAYCQRTYMIAVTDQAYQGSSSVTRAVCVCASNAYLPYCTPLPDPYNWYDGFEATAVPPPEVPSQNPSQEPSQSPPTSSSTTPPVGKSVSARHSTPKIPIFAVALYVVGLLLSAVPLTIVVVCLVRVHGLRVREVARRRVIVQQRQAEEETPENVPMLLDSSQLTGMRLREPS